MHTERKIRMNRAKLGEIAPLNTSDMHGWSFSGDFLRMNGLVVAGVHPSRITISDESIVFDYSVGGESISRVYTLTKSDGKITSVTAPDGITAEVTR